MNWLVTEIEDGFLRLQTWEELHTQQRTLQSTNLSGLVDCPASASKHQRLDGSPNADLRSPRIFPLNRASSAGAR
jgi:hypothetical protein